VISGQVGRQRAAIGYARGLLIWKWRGKVIGRPARPLEPSRPDRSDHP